MIETVGVSTSGTRLGKRVIDEFSNIGFETIELSKFHSDRADNHQLTHFSDLSNVLSSLKTKDSIDTLIHIPSGYRSMLSNSLVYITISTQLTLEGANMCGIDTVCILLDIGLLFGPRPEFDMLPIDESIMKKHRRDRIEQFISLI